jgi:membrane dipeptidase
MRKWIIALLLAVTVLFVEAFAIQSFLPYLIILFIVAFIILAALEIIPAQFEKRMNRVKQKPPYKVSEGAAEVHKNLFVVDLHADALLWNRDLIHRYDYGHVDIPRLIDGNVGFQVFGVVTKSPRGQNFQTNQANAPDNITLLTVIQAWPPRTWRSLLQRALYQAEKLEKFAQRSRGQLIFVRSQKDLERLLEMRQQEQRVIGGFPCLEGVHALEGKIENLDILYDAGFRMIGLTHFFDNEAGGSAHGIQKGGLTPFGRQVVERAQEKKMIIDLAHSSPQVVCDVLEMTKAPVIASHSGVRGTYESVRNLSDQHVRGIAQSGGVVGIAMFDEAVGECSLEATVRAMRYTADLVGVDHVALGGDLDGVVVSPVDVSGVPLLTELLLRHGFDEGDAAQIMGENALRVFRAVLPEE